MPPERTGWPVWPWVLLLVGLVLVLIVRVGFAPQPEPSGERHPAVGSKVTTFQLQPLTGDSREVTEADLAGKVTLVNFWGPWCSACVVEFPHLVELEKHFREKPGFQFFSISSNMDLSNDTDLQRSTVDFLKHHHADFPTYRDPNGTTVLALERDAKLGSTGFPTTVLIGQDGVIRALWTGYSPGDEDQARIAIEKALLALRK
jgi:cytochrome c biogenesis protein CcmG/thiol:disulfide interchange protein DsbE